MHNSMDMCVLVRDFSTFLLTGVEDCIKCVDENKDDGANSSGCESNEIDNCATDSAGNHVDSDGLPKSDDLELSIEEEPIY